LKVLVRRIRYGVNGELVGGLGTVASGNQITDGQTEQPQIYANIMNVTPKNGKLDIVVHVSNYSFRENGIFGNVQIGTLAAIIGYVFGRHILQDLLLIGVFVVVGIGHVMIYLLNQRESDLLWLAGVCLTGALHTLLLNKLLMHLLLPDATWSLLMSLQYSTKFIVLLMYIKLIYALYRQDANQIMHRICVGVILLALIYVAERVTRAFTTERLISKR
jgi:hypothetical protein